MCMPTMAGSENLRMDRAQLENRSSEEVMRVGRYLVTPVALSASVARFTWSAVQPGVLKSTPAKPLTCKSKKPRNSILILTLELFCCAVKQTATSAFQVSQKLVSHVSALRLMTDTISGWSGDEQCSPGLQLR